MAFPGDVATHGLLDSPLSTAAIRGRLGFADGLSYQDLLDEARQLVGDEGLNGCPVRYTDAQLVSALNRGLQELGRIRPDAFYDMYSANNLNIPEITDLAPAIDQTNWTTLFELNFNFWPPLVYYVVSQADMTEDEYVMGGKTPYGSRAAGSLRLFRKHVLSV